MKQVEFEPAFRRIVRKAKKRAAKKKIDQFVYMTSEGWINFATELPAAAAPICRVKHIKGKTHDDKNG